MERTGGRLIPPLLIREHPAPDGP
jgi:hypothetical protein